MRLAFSRFVAIIGTVVVLGAAPLRLSSQEVASAGSTAGAWLPEAPTPQVGIGGSKETFEQGAGEQTAPAPNAPTPGAASGNAPGPSGAPAAGAGQSSSAAQAPGNETAAQKSQREIADEQLKQQEKQRVMGVMATFNTTRNMDAAPLTSGQKYKLFFKSATDPWPFLLAGVVSGFDQATNSPPEWGQGWGPYAQRFGADYSDYFIGNFIGNAVLPSLLHEDPRYFQKGKGKVISRIIWAAGSSFWCKRDNGGWGPNYANVSGNFIGAAIGRAYHPASERDVRDTLMDGLTVTVEGMPGAELIEFWPDMVRAHNRKKAEKQARLDKQAGQGDSSEQDKKPQAEQK